MARRSLAISFMNLILLEEEDFIGTSRVRLQGRRSAHALDILNATQGKVLQVGLLGGRTGTGTVIAVAGQSLEMDVVLDRAPPAPLPLTLILALPRPKVCKRILQSLASFGVNRVILLNSWRVDRSYWQSPVLEPQAIREQLLLGLEQGRDTRLPTVDLQQRFKPFVEDTLPAIAAETCALVAHPKAPRPCPTAVNRPITLAVGPEGGFTPYEIELLAAAGLVPVHLGERPLRVETAVPALIGRLLPTL